MSARREKMSEGSTADVRWIPASTAAGMLKVTRQRVYALIREGYLTGCKLDGHTLVSLRSVHDRLARQSSMEV
jgi:hypothetical protein